MASVFLKELMSTSLQKSLKKRKTRCVLGKSDIYSSEVVPMFSKSSLEVTGECSAPACCPIEKPAVELWGRTFSKASQNPSSPNCPTMKHKVITPCISRTKVPELFQIGELPALLNKWGPNPKAEEKEKRTASKSAVHSVFLHLW